MRVDDQRIRNTSFYSPEWAAKKALLENDRCQIAEELRIWSIGNDRIRVQLLRTDGTTTGVFDMMLEQFEERSPNDFIQDMWALSDTNAASM
jgi:hypothetical protein